MRRRVRQIVHGALLWSAFAAVASAAAPPKLAGKKYAAAQNIGREIIGTEAPEWDLTDWIPAERFSLRSLRGKVVLVRWWTAPGCPYCEASAEALNAWAARYRERGLVVLGVYHHKADTPLTREHVAEQVKRLPLRFPVAVDPDWRTLRKWWLDREPRGWTSATFLIDRAGVIRHVHGGGAYFKGEPGYDAIEKAIERALLDSSAQPGAPPPSQKQAGRPSLEERPDVAPAR